MVNKSDMNEHQIEELLRKLPEIKDHRDPRDIYQNVNLRLQKRNRKIWFLPSLAAAAVIIVGILLLPTFMDWNQSSEKSLDQRTASESEKIGQISEGDKSEENRIKMTSEEQEKTPDIENEEGEETYTAVYDSDMEGNRVLTYAIPDAHAENVIHVSVVAPEEKDKTFFEQYIDTMAVLKEEEWGLKEYYPLNAKLSFDEDSQTLNVDLPEEHQYGSGSANETIFSEILSHTANMIGAEKITLSTEGNSGAMFGNFGELDEMPVQEEMNHAYYLFYPGHKEGKPYLVASKDSFETVESAIKSMKKGAENGSLFPSLPPEFVIHDVFSKDGTLLVIRLDEKSKLANNDSMIHSIEALLLTAKDFRYRKVKIENSNLEKVGKFNFNEEWTVPVAPNKVVLSE